VYRWCTETISFGSVPETFGLKFPGRAVPGGPISFRLADTSCFRFKPKTYCFWGDKTAPETNGFRPAYFLTDTNNFGNVFGSPKPHYFRSASRKSG
jgi:hypothetical protein